MTKEQYKKLGGILNELEWDYGYGPSFEVNESSDLYSCINSMKRDFINYKMELVNGVLTESKLDILRRIDEL